MSQAGAVNLTGSIPTTVAINFQTDSGIAVPSGNVIDILGSAGTTTTGATNIVRIVPGYEKFTSPTIDFTAIGNTTIFTNGSSRFVPFSITFVSDNVVNFSGDGDFNLGFTGPNFTDYLASDPFELNGIHQFSSFLIDGIGGGADFALLPASTALVLRVTTGITADTFTGRAIVMGFTV